MKDDEELQHNILSECFTYSEPWPELDLKLHECIRYGRQNVVKDCNVTGLWKKYDPALAFLCDIKNRK